MTKEDVFSLIIYIGMLGIALAVGFLVVMPAFNNGFLFDDSGARIGFLLGAIIVAILFNAILLEGGHLIGSKLGGYTILSFNLLGFCYYKEKMDDGSYKAKFKFPKSFDGLTGETQIYPNKEKANPMFYVFAPLVLFLLEIVAMYISIIMIPDTVNGIANDLNWIKYGLIIFATIGCMFILYNYFPTRLDSLTDGYKLTLLTKKINVEAYNEYLTILGLGLVEDETKEIKIFDELTDFTADVNMLSVYQAMIFDKYDYANARLRVRQSLFVANVNRRSCRSRAMWQMILNGKLSKYTVLEAKIEKAFIYFLTENNEEMLKKYFNETFNSEERKYIKKVNCLQTLRLYLLFEGLIEQSKSEIEYCKNKFKKLKDNENLALANIEEKLYLKALKRIETKNNN